LNPPNVLAAAAKFAASWARFFFSSIARRICSAPADLPAAPLFNLEE
jgi:hypothetical protein